MSKPKPETNNEDATNNNEIKEQKVNNVNPDDYTYPYPDEIYVEDVNSNNNDNNKKKPNALQKLGKNVGKFVKGTKDKIVERMSMEGLLKKARKSLEIFISPKSKLKIEEQIPKQILKGAKGIVFLSIIKGGLIVGVSGGIGLMIARMEYGGWSGPIALGCGGVQLGFSGGIGDTDHILVLNDMKTVKLFCSKGQFNLGGSASIAIGPKGRDANIKGSMNSKGKISKSIMYSYSLSKGLYAGIDIKAEIIGNKPKINAKFYETKKVKLTEIFDGTLPEYDIENDDYLKIIKMLDEYGRDIGKSHGQLAQEMSNNAEEPNSVL